MALALSRVSTEERNANETNTVVSNTPVSSSVTPVVPDPKRKSGIPTPTINAKIKLIATERYRLKNIESLLIGCANSNSVNSYELKK